MVCFDQLLACYAKSYGALVLAGLALRSLDRPAVMRLAWPRTE